MSEEMKAQIVDGGWLGTPWGDGRPPGRHKPMRMRQWLLIVLALVIMITLNAMMASALIG